MNFIEKLVDKYITQPNQRNMVEFFNAKHQGASFGNHEFGDSNIYSNNISIFDHSVDPQIITNVCKDPVILGIKESIKKQILEKGYGFRGGKTKSKALLEMLKSLDYDKFLSDSFEALYGSGGGNAIVYLQKDGRNTKIKVEPFMAEGRHRVKVMVDDNNRKILKYEVLNSTQSIIKTFESDEVIHIKAIDNGNFAFGFSPAKAAAKYFNLKQRILYSLENKANNSLENKRVLAPDTAFLSSLDKEYQALSIDRWIKFKDQITQRLPGYITAPMPITSANLQENFENPKEMLAFINTEFGAAYLTPLSIIGLVESLKYSNAEQTKDNFVNLVVNPNKTFYKNVTEQIIQFFDPFYNPELNPFFFGEEADDEKLAIRDQKIDIIEKLSPLLLTQGLRISKESIQNLAGEFGIELEDYVGDNLANDQSNQTDNLDIQRSQKKNPKFELDIERLKDSKNYQIAKTIIFDGIKKQINSSKLVKDKTTREYEVENIEQFMPLERYKKAVSLFAQSSLDIYNQFYNTTHTKSEIQGFIDLYSKVAMFGWQGVKTSLYSQDIIEMVNLPKDYKGFNNTTKDGLFELNNDKEKQAFIQNRQKTVLEGMESNIYHNTNFKLAEIDGKEYVGVWTSNDDRVRLNHRPNDKKYGERSVMLVFAREQGCRCVYVAGTIEELESYGLIRK